MGVIYSYEALNDYALSETGHFLFLSPWQYIAVLSILAQASPLYFWKDSQEPLTPAETDDLQAKLDQAQSEMMRSIVGLIMPAVTSTPPYGTLLCDGTSYARADYPDLYDALDAAYIVDASTFITPDLRDQFVLAAGPTYAANSTGGAATHTQTVAEMPAHSHTTTPHSHAEITALPTPITIGAGVPAPSAIPGVGTTGLSGVTVDNEGGGAAMDILPPYYALRYVVVAL